MKKLLSIAVLTLATASLSAIGPLRITRIELTPIPCDSPESTATVKLCVAGGIPPYQFLLDDQPSDSNIFDNLEGPEHQFTVIDEEGITLTVNMNVGPSVYSSLVLTIEPDCPNQEQAIVSIFTKNSNGDATNTLQQLTSGSPPLQVIEGDGSFNPIDPLPAWVLNSFPPDQTNDCPQTNITFPVAIRGLTGNKIDDFTHCKYCTNIPC